MFQITEEEIDGQSGLFDEFEPGRMESFLFVAVDLDASVPCTRTDLADMTRAINRRYQMPVVVAFRHGMLVTLAVVHRRAHKLDPERDVLEKVTLIKDIRSVDPHRAHLDIVAELALPSLRELSGVRSFDDLHRAWEQVLDAETLNRRFYRELFDWFERAVGTCRFPDDGAGPGSAERQVIRLITRLLFIWFVAEKRLVPDELFTEDFAREALNNHSPEGTDYYRAVLQNLFFATLNTEIARREFSARNRDSHRDFNRYRYRDLLSNPDAFLQRLNGVPFVNGGLFDCLDDYIGRHVGGRRIDAFTDNIDNQGHDLSVPAHLFFATDGLFPLFRRYKFTVEENTPLDQEVALDPELLGRVFENLLAAYNPETRESARKASGSYYTPRHIVDYMVDETMAAALAERAKPSDGDETFLRDRLNYLLDYGDAAADAGDLFEAEEKRAIVRAIAELRVLDPAVGSGAFPMGVLHKLTLALRRLDPDNRHWEHFQKQLARSRAGRAFDVADASVRERELQEISRTFEIYRQSDFGRKLYLIQNGMFGVDIQPVACQIAKLRCFISLVVEQHTTSDPEDNYGILPLPNLETRFVAADTLLGLDSDGIGVLRSAMVTRIEEQLRRVREGYFNARTRQAKLDLRRRDTDLRMSLARELEAGGFPHDNAQDVAQWDPYDQNASAAWFDAEWMFGIPDGFDVVIGNPPYVRGEKIPTKGALRGAYGDFYRGSADLYTYFVRKGIDLLRSNGLLCYITSNKFMRAAYGEPLRAYLKQHAPPRVLLDLGRTGTFDATVRPCVLLVGKEAREATLWAATVRGEGSATAPGIFMQQNGFDLPVAYLADAGWTLAPPPWQRLRTKIEEAGQPLREYVDTGIYYGVKTGLNDAFVIDAATRARLIAEDPNSAELIRAWLRGRDVRRYRADYADLYVVFARRGTAIERYPAIEKHLSRFRRDLEPKRQRGARHGRKPGSYQWFEIQDNIAYYREFDRPKIIYPDIGRSMRALLDRRGHFTGNTCYIIPGDDAYLLALLNSKLLDFYFRLTMPCLDDPFDNGDLRFFSADLERTPIVAPDAGSKQLLGGLAQQIQTAKEADPDSETSALEARIDTAVYQLYGLSRQDIAVLDAALLAEPAVDQD